MLPIRSVNSLLPREKLRYDPSVQTDGKDKAQIAVLLAPKRDSSSKDLTVLGPEQAGEPVTWEIPKKVELVALIYGPQGLSVKKLKSLMEKNQEILVQLADYADQTAQVEGLIQALQTSEQSGKNVQAALSGFSAQYNVSVPKLDPKASTDQQADQLLRALMPSVSTYDPLASKTQVMQQSAGLAAAVASLFFGSPVGLAAGGASLFQNMRTLMFPDTEFRTAFVPLSTGDGLALCAKAQAAKSRTRIAYLWAHKVPELVQPTVGFSGNAHLPIGSKSLLHMGATPDAPFKNVSHAREWALVSADGKTTVPAAVTMVPGGDALEIDLTKTKAAPGEYRLAAKWDWDAFRVQGLLFLHPYGNPEAAKVATESRDRLVEGNGRVAAKLTGTDFQFIEKVALERADQRQKSPQEIPFTLPKGPRGGEQTTMEVEIDTGTLRRGNYRLLLTQSDGLTHELAFSILPPNPRIENLPLRTNLGEAVQHIRLKGTGLDRIEKLASEVGEVELKAAEAGGTRREAVVKLGQAAKKGDVAALRMKVQGIEQPFTVERALEVAGPRPKISSIRKSFPQDFAVALRQNEVPAGSMVSFAVSVENLDAAAVGRAWNGPGAPLSVEITCAHEVGLRNKLTLMPGDSGAGAKLNVAGEGMLFLSLDPGAVGQSGCELSATVTAAATGTSDAFALGKIARVPRVERFVLTDEKIGKDLYAGTLTGQDLDTIEKTGWDAQSGTVVQSIPTPVAGEPGKQVLKVALPWPAPAPHAPIFVWLRGESQGRATGVKY